MFICLLLENFMALPTNSNRNGNYRKTLNREALFSAGINSSAILNGIKAIKGKSYGQKKASNSSKCCRILMAFSMIIG